LVKSAKGAKLGMSQFLGLKAAVGLGGGESAASSVSPSDTSSITSNPYGFGGLDLSLAGSIAGPGDSVHSSHSSKGKAADEQEW